MEKNELVILPKMQFIFDSNKISPAKIDKTMIDFETAEKQVAKIEELYNAVFTDVESVKKIREEVASIKGNADNFKKELMDFLNADTKEVNKKLIDLIKRVEAVRKFLHDKEKELDNAKREKIEEIKNTIFKDNLDYLTYLVNNPRWENKTFKENDIEAEIQQQYDEFIKKENFIKQELEKANQEIEFIMTFESMKYLLSKDYAEISTIITDKKNEHKKTEENLRQKAKEQAELEKQREIEEIEKRKQLEIEKAKRQAEREAKEKLRKEKQEEVKQQQTNEENISKKDPGIYINIKVSGLTKEATQDLLDVIKKHNLKYIKEEVK